jgi:hypothetical protein
MVPPLRRPSGWHKRAMRSTAVVGKIISYRARGFPSAASIGPCLIGIEGAGKLQTHKVIAIKVIDPHGLSPDYPGKSGQRALRPDWRAGDLQGNSRRSRQRTANDDQCSTGGDIDSGGKLQGILPVSITSPDKNRNGQLQPRPFPCFFAHILARLATSHLNHGNNYLFGRTLHAKVYAIGVMSPKPSEPRYQRGI